VSGPLHPGGYDFFKAIQLALRDWLAGGMTETAPIYGDPE
jgi:hypothetical protein